MFGLRKRNQAEKSIPISNVGKKGREIVEWLNNNFAFNSHIVTNDTKILIEFGQQKKNGFESRQKELQYLSLNYRYNASTNRYAITITVHSYGQQLAVFEDGYPRDDEFANLYKIPKSAFEIICDMVELYNNRGWITLTGTQALAFSRHRELLGEYIIQKDQKWSSLVYEVNNYESQNY